MCSSAPKLVLFLFLLSVSSICEKDLEDEKDGSVSEKEKIIEESFEQTSDENNFSLESMTTTESTTTVEAYRKLSVSIAGDKNISRQFRPSVHLGEIKESRIGTNPFNNVQHIRFENDVDPSSYREQLHGYVLQPTGQSVQPVDYQANFHQNLFDAALEESKKQGTEQNSYVKFQDEAANIPRIHYGSVSKDQPFHQQFAHSIAENTAAQYDLIDQELFQNLEEPVYEQDASSFFGKPSKFQSEAHKHELGSFSNNDPMQSPYFGGVYEHQSNQPIFHNLEASKRPNNGLVYVQESTFMTTRKFPYSFYQPLGGHRINFVDGNRSIYPVRQRVSPWRKILRLIGAFLPFGLLLAALTPNVVKVDNTTQPNIVLSKWRVADLPVEHKQARFAEERSCEERSICELISAGGNDESSVLQHLLWSLATRTSNTVARENGLEEIFEAIKRKDCAKLDC